MQSDAMALALILLLIAGFALGFANAILPAPSPPGTYMPGFHDGIPAYR